MQENFEVLTKNFKQMAEILGKYWKYTYHDSNLPQEDDYMDSQDLNFNLNGDEILLSVHHSDPDSLIIYSGTLMISFGPVEHIHISETEPKVIIESFNGDRVNFIEINSDGKFYEYHNFPKNQYRLDLHKK